MNQYIPSVQIEGEAISPLSTLLSVLQTRMLRLLLLHVHSLTPLSPLTVDDAVTLFWKCLRMSGAAFQMREGQVQTMATVKGIWK